MPKERIKQKAVIPLGFYGFRNILPLPFAGITRTGLEGLPASKQGLSALKSSPSDPYYENFLSL
jgi:hypothetical protein